MGGRDKYAARRLRSDQSALVFQLTERTPVFLQRNAGVRARVRCDLGRCAHTYHLSAAVAALRPEVDDPVRGADDVEVVLDHHQRMASRDQLPEGSQQLGDVVEVQPGGGFVEQKERAASQMSGAGSGPSRG